MKFTTLTFFFDVRELLMFNAKINVVAMEIAHFVSLVFRIIVRTLRKTR